MRSTTANRPHRLHRAYRPHRAHRLNRPRDRRRGGRALAAALIALGCAIALAACGSSKSDNSSASLKSAGLRFAECMRSHGVTNFPDPSTSSGGGIQIGPNSGINPQSPAFQTAQRACVKLLPGGGPGRGQGSEARKKEMLRLAECMRAHGVPSFPDPTSSPPSAPPSGGGLAFGGPGGFLSIPQSLTNSPAFATAASACHFPLPGRGAPKANAAPG